MLRLSARTAQHYMEVLLVIHEKNRQPHENQQRITGKCARLQEADGEAEELRQLGAEVEQPVDDPLVPPHGKLRGEAREPAGAVHADAVDDFGVEATEKRSKILGAIHECGVIDLVHIVFVEQKVIKPRESAGGKFRGQALGTVEFIGQPEAKRDDGQGSEHEAEFLGDSMVGNADRPRFGDDARQNRIEEALETIFAAEDGGPSDPSADGGKASENQERDGHGMGRFMDVLFHVLIGAAVANEGKEKQPEHVEGRQSGGDETNDPKSEKAVKGAAKDFVFAEESGERKNSGDGQGGNSEGSGSGGYLPPKAAHFADVLLAGHRVNHAAGAEEQKRFEECMGRQMEDSGGERSDTQGEKHVAELGDRGIGKDFLDVILNEGHGGSKNRSDCADDGNDVEGEGRKLIKGVHARNHVDAGSDHGGGVDQGADRRGAFHRVGEPDVERDLRGFSASADEKQKSNGGKDWGSGSQGMRADSGFESLTDSGIRRDICESRGCETNGAESYRG